MCGRLRAACQDFGIRVSEIDPGKVDVGPSVLRYKLKLSPGEQGDKLRRQAENIARQLAANSVPIIEFLRGTEFMYLDLAQPDREVVYLEPLLKNFTASHVNELPLHAGIDPAGKRYTLDLGDDRLPHLLVAGGTGSGKTIFLYSVILSLVTVHTPRTLELLIVDPKQTDFAVFGSLPHLRGKRVITDAAKGVESLKEIAAHDLQSRSDMLQKAQLPRHQDVQPRRPRSKANGPSRRHHRRVCGPRGGLTRERSGGVRPYCQPSRRAQTQCRHPFSHRNSATYGRCRHGKHQGQYAMSDLVQPAFKQGLAGHPGRARRRASSSKWRHAAAPRRSVDASARILRRHRRDGVIGACPLRKRSGEHVHEIRDH